ncbi:uncharacterized protein LOC121990748 [Zingiber officinale]|uniref:uncharacterized protein LOC121990748 n=1 Tax=Zingiber officinale TaxID=94328 RepID=UPI001C4C32B2|nr:uncharacterized protein LOC121990748 [Zingiber officinale]
MEPVRSLPFLLLYVSAIAIAIAIASADSSHSLLRMRIDHAGGGGAADGLFCDSWRPIQSLVIDIILQEMDIRFSETTTDLLIYMSCLDPGNSFSRFDVQKLVRLAHFYEDDFSWNERMLVEQELETYIDDVRLDERFEGISDLGALAKKIIETMKNRVFPLVYRMIELALLLPVATATVERVFSAMNIVKTDLRNRIGDERMNDSLVVYIEKDVFNTVDNEPILQRFHNMESRRMQLSRIR